MTINLNVGVGFYFNSYVGEFISKYNEVFETDIGDELGNDEYKLKLDDYKNLIRYFDMLGATSQVRGSSIVAQHQTLIDAESQISLVVIIIYNLYSQRLKFIPYSYSRLGRDQIFYSSKSLKTLYDDYVKESTSYMVESLG